MRKVLAAAAVMVLSSAVAFAAAGAPVIDAVKSGNVEAVRAALLKRADVNLAEADGMTALHWAARNNDLVSARLLLRAGANPDALDSQGRAPAQWANGNASIEWLLREGSSQRTVPADRVLSQ